MRLPIMMLLVTLSLPVYAQNSQLTLDRIFKSKDFKNESFGPAKWTDGGKAYTTLEGLTPQYPGRKEIIEYQAKSGNRAVLVAAKDLIPAGSDQPLRIKNYKWSPKKNYLLIYTNVQRVWRDSTRGDYWVKDLHSGTIRQLGSNLPESSLMFAKFSPDDSRVAYVSEHNIYVEDINSGSITPLTKDGTDKLINGTF